MSRRSPAPPATAAGIARPPASRLSSRSRRSLSSCASSTWKHVPPRGLDPSGVVLVDKPAGPSSFAVVRDLRDRTGARAGHAGTLDPFATGLLLVLLGRATRLQRYLVALPKVYRATARLGWRSSTGDREGALEQTGRVPADLALPVGRVRQRVPMTSAVKVEGRR